MADSRQGALIDFNTQGIYIPVPLLPLPTSSSSCTSFPVSPHGWRNPFDSLLMEASSHADPFEQSKNNSVKSDETFENDNFSITLPICHVDLLSDIPDYSPLQHKSDEVLTGNLLSQSPDNILKSERSSSSGQRSLGKKRPRWSKDSQVDSDQNTPSPGQTSGGKGIKVDGLVPKKAKKGKLEKLEACSGHPGTNANESKLEEMNGGSEEIKEKSTSKTTPPCSSCEMENSIKSAVVERIGQYLKKARLKFTQCDSLAKSPVRQAQPFQGMQLRPFMPSRVAWRNEYMLNQSGFSPFHQRHSPYYTENFSQRKFPFMYSSHEQPRTPIQKQRFLAKSNLMSNDSFSKERNSGFNYQRNSLLELSKESLKDMSFDVTFDSEYHTHSQVETGLHSANESNSYCVPRDSVLIPGNSLSRSIGDSKQEENTLKRNCLDIPEIGTGSQTSQYCDPLPRRTKSPSPIGNPIACSSPCKSSVLPSQRKPLERKCLDLQTSPEKPHREKEKAQYGSSFRKSLKLPRAHAKLQEGKSVNITKDQGTTARKSFPQGQKDKTVCGRSTNYVSSRNKAPLQPRGGFPLSKGVKAASQAPPVDNSIKKSGSSYKPYLKNNKKK